jgi:hypothetical protein
VRRLLNLPYSAVEDAQLRALVYVAFDRRGQPGYHEAIRAIEDWYVQSLPVRLARLEGRRA